MSKRDRWLAVVALVLAGVFVAHDVLDRPPARRARAQGEGNGGVIARASLWNSTAPTASTNLLATSIKPTLNPSVLRIGVTLKVSGVFYVVEHNGAGTTQTYAFNSGSALNAFQNYTFVWPMRAYDNDDPTSGANHVLDYNFQLGSSTNGGVAALRCDEVIGPAD